MNYMSGRCIRGLLQKLVYYGNDSLLSVREHEAIATGEAGSRSFRSFAQHGKVEGSQHGLCLGSTDLLAAFISSTASSCKKRGAGVLVR